MATAIAVGILTVATPTPPAFFFQPVAAQFLAMFPSSWQHAQWAHLAYKKHLGQTLLPVEQSILSLMASAGFQVIGTDASGVVSPTAVPFTITG